MQNFQNKHFFIFLPPFHKVKKNHVFISISVHTSLTQGFSIRNSAPDPAPAQVPASSPAPAPDPASSSSPSPAPASVPDKYLLELKKETFDVS